MSWLVRRVMALRSVPGPCGWSAHGAAGIVVLVVLDVLGRAGRRAPPVGRVVGVLRPGAEAGIVALVVLDALARLGRHASPFGGVAGVLRPGAAISGGATVLACAPGDGAAVGAE